MFNTIKENKRGRREDVQFVFVVRCRAFMEAYVVQQLWVLVLCSVIVLATLWIMKKKGNVEYPPGPRGLPIIGHLHMLERLPHRTLTRLSKIYGPLMSIRFGSYPSIVASSPDMAKLMLHTHDKTLSGRPPNFSAPRIMTGGHGIAFASPGPYWKLMRQLCFTEIFSAKRLNHLKPLRVEELRNLMISIYDAKGMPLSIRKNLYKTNMNMISRMVLRQSLEEIAAEMPSSEKNITDTLLDLFSLLGLFSIGDFIPWLSWIDHLQGCGKRAEECGRFAHSVFQKVIERRRSGHSSDDQPPLDFLDVLLATSRDSKNTQIQIGDDNIRAMIIDLFIGGSDTTAVTTEWALTALLTNPQKLKTLQEEIDRIVGSSRLVQEADLPNLPYLRAVVNETMRLHPTAPLRAPHMAMEASQICGYQIPKNTMVYVNTSAIHGDPNIWENPLDFSPERFLGTNTDVLTQQCKFLPFSAGRRMCPGIALALLSVQSVLANLVHAFDWKTLPKPNFKEKIGLVLALEEPLLIVPLPKLPKSLLETLA